MISVVIPFKARSSFDNKLLQNLLNQILIQGKNMVSEIIIIDSSQKDASVKPLAPFNSNIRFIHNPALKVGEARNVGVKVAKENIVLFLDADCELPQGFFKNVERLMKDLSEDVIAIGGPVKSTPKSSIIQKYFDYSIFSPFPRHEHGHIIFWKNFHKHHHPNMCNLMIRRDVFLKTGGCWPEAGEDVYYQLKVTRLGYKIKYSPKLLVFHNNPKSFIELTRKFIRLGTSAANLFLEFPTSPLMLHRFIKSLIIILPLLVMIFIQPLVGTFMLFMPLLIFYFYRTKKFKHAIIYTFLDVSFQLVYLTAFTKSLLKELMMRGAKRCLRV